MGASSAVLQLLLSMIHDTDVDVAREVMEWQRERGGREMPLPEVAARCRERRARVAVVVALAQGRFPAAAKTDDGRPFGRSCEFVDPSTHAAYVKTTDAPLCAALALSLLTRGQGGVRVLPRR
jgi:hypothetical protein